MKNNYKTRCYVLFMSCGRLINYSTYCAAFIVCSRQYQSFVQVAGELLQSAIYDELSHSLGQESPLNSPIRSDHC
jgi:hypothetical protein